MILVDTSVLIDFLRTKDARLGNLFQTLPSAICGAIRAEVLAGARTPADRKRLMTFLAPFGQILTSELTWETVGDHLAQLAANGLTVPFVDVLIATLAIANNAELWQRDRHFPVMQRVLPGLRLFQEPP